MWAVYLKLYNLEWLRPTAYVEAHMTKLGGTGRWEVSLHIWFLTTGITCTVTGIRCDLYSACLDMIELTELLLQNWTPLLLTCILTVKLHVCQCCTKSVLLNQECAHLMRYKAFGFKHMSLGGIPVNLQTSFSCTYHEWMSSASCSFSRVKDYTVGALCESVIGQKRIQNRQILMKNVSWG